MRRSCCTNPRSADTLHHRAYIYLPCLKPGISIAELLLTVVYTQIVNLNNSVGSTERCQGGFISPAIDDDSTGTDLEMSPELTSVDILDYTLTNHINFEVKPGQAFCPNAELKSFLIAIGMIFGLHPVAQRGTFGAS